MNKRKTKMVGTALAAAVAIAAVVVGSVTEASAAKPRSPVGSPSLQDVQVAEVSFRLADRPDQLVNVQGAAPDDGTPLIQWSWSGLSNERWRADATLEGYYRFKSVSSGKCMNVQGGGSADGTPVIQYACGSLPNELWRFVPTGIGYQIVNKESGKCLNVKGGVLKGNPLIQYACVAGGATNDVWLPVWERTAN
jgi:hypothetical protein